MKKVCVKDIAEACGCSIGTVSKALNNTDRVSKAVADRIRRTAAEMGYRSSFSAHSLASRRRRTGVVLFDAPSDVRKLFESGIDEAMSLYGEFGIEYEYIRFKNINELDFDELSERFSALVITPSFINEETAAALVRAAEKIPVVYLQSVPDFDSKSTRIVTVDAECAGRMAAEFLSLCAPTNQVAVVAGFKNRWIHARNIEGFRDCAMQFGLDIIDVEDCQDDMEKAYAATQKILDSHPGIGGIFVTSYVSDAVGQCIADNHSDAKIVGVDIFKGSAEKLKSGTISALIFQNQKLQAMKAIEAAVSVFRGISVKSYISVKPELVLKSNLSLYEEDII